MNFYNATYRTIKLAGHVNMGVEVIPPGRARITVNKHATLVGLEDAGIHLYDVKFQPVIGLEEATELAGPDAIIIVSADVLAAMEEQGLSTVRFAKVGDILSLDDVGRPVYEGLVVSKDFF